MSDYFGYVARCIAYRQARGKWAAPQLYSSSVYKSKPFSPAPKLRLYCRLWHGSWTRGLVLNKCLYGKPPLLLARSNPLPFYIPFFTKKVQCAPFVYLLLTNGTPLYIPCLELCTPFNCCKCTVF